MMLGSEGKRKLGAFLTFLAPVILVKVTGVYLGETGPGPAAASPVPPAAIVMPAKPTTSMSQADLDLARYVSTLRAQSIVRSPFIAPVIADDKQNDAGPAMSEPTRAAPLRATLQAILGGTSGDLALIDGRPYRTGDSVAGTAWRIESIDRAARTVRFTNVDTGESDEKSISTR